MKSIGLYLHVPFCRSKCPYCDFCSQVPKEGEVDRYLRALAREAGLRRDGRGVASVYFGGGTPSFIGAERLGAMMEAVRANFRLEGDCEITVEANPADATADWLRACRAMGANRLSLGVQGMREEDLRFLGRAHTASEAAAAGRRARAAGFDNLGIDLIVGLPGHTPALTRKILRVAVEAFAPEHVSCYQLTCASDTPLHDAVARGRVRMPGGDEEAAIFLAAHEALAALGYEGYEASNFARTPARRSRHNIGYWTGRDYLGLGPSAHSFIAPVRSWNTRSPADYCALLERGELPTAGEERLTPKQRAAEIVLLGLRASDGFSLDEIRRVAGADLLAEKAAALAEAERDGLLRVQGDRVRPTLRGMALADRLAVLLAPD